MGAFYTTITLRGPEQARVVEYLKGQGRVAFVSPTVDGCTVVYDKECESQDEKILKRLASTLSAHFDCPALAALVHDDDVLLYWLYQGGKLGDRYNSCPGYFTGQNRKPSGGNAEVLCEAFGVVQQIEEVRRILHTKESLGGDWPLTMAASPDKITEMVQKAMESGQELNDESMRQLMGDGYSSASDRHEQLARALGLPSFSTNLGYHYIEQGEWMEDFDHPIYTEEQQMSKKPSHGGFGGRPGGAPNQSAMLRQIQKMQEDMAAAQAALETETVEASVGGGAVTVVITGGQKVQSITINKEMIDTSDEEWITDLQDLLVAAVNQAIEKAQALASDRMGGVTGGLDSMLPGGLGGLLG